MNNCKPTFAPPCTDKRVWVCTNKTLFTPSDSPSSTMEVGKNKRLTKGRKRGAKEKVVDDFLRKTGMM